MMHLIVECGVDPVLNDDTQEKPDDNSPDEEVMRRRIVGRIRSFGRLRRERAMIMGGCSLR